MQIPSGLAASPGQSKVTMMREQILFGQTMNCRSFGTTPPSRLFHAAADVSSHCIHVSHSGHISEMTGVAGKLLLPLHPKLPCCSLNEGHNYFVCPPQNIYDHFAPIFPCFQMFLGVHTYSSHIFTFVSALQHYLRFTGGAEPKVSGVGFPYPPPGTIYV